MRLLTLAICLIGLTALGQGSVRRANSLTNLLATVDPANVATGGKVTYLVPGYYEGVSWGGDREITATKTPGVTNLGQVWMSPVNTNWYWRAPVGSVENVLFWGVFGGVGSVDDTVALQAAANSVTAGKMLYSPAGNTYLTTNTIYLTNDRVRLDFSGSTIKFNATTRKAAVSAGPSVAVVTGMDFALSISTNRVTGVPASTFSSGDMVLLYNDVQSPANYNPGQLAFVTAASGTEITLDRFPDSALQVTNAYRFVDTPDSVVIRNVVVDLSGATDGVGISAIGRGHLVENCRVIGTGTTNDPNYIGIELRGQSITARKNFVQGILDAGNATDRSGYGIFAAGDNIVVDDNELLDCKHCVSTSERKAVSHELRVINNRIRQRDDWAGLTDVNGAYLFTAALDVHANVRHVEIRGNDVKIGGRYALSLRNGNFDVLFNRIEVTAQTLPFAQHTIGLAEELVERGLFHGNQCITADGATLLYFAQADSGVSGTHSNLSFVANSFKNCILSLDDFDTTAAVTNGFANTVISGNTFNRPGGTTLLFSGPSSNAIVTGNSFTHGGSGISVAIPGDDTTNPAREIYIAGNTFSRTGGTAGDVRVLSGPQNIVELGNNRFSEVPTQGFDGRVAVSRTPATSERYQLIESDDDELFFNSPSATNPARLKWGGTGALLGNETEFVSFRTSVSDRAFASYHNDVSALPFVDQYQFVIKADGLMSWSDGDNAAQIVLGPRRNSDVTDGVLRLSGGFGLTERSEPIIPSATTATLWLEEADTSKSLKIKWPDGSNTALWPNTNAPFFNSQPPSYYLDRANHTGTQSYTTITGLGDMALVADAPNDGQEYARKNLGWSLITTGGGATNVFAEMTNILVAGANVTIVVDSTNQTITISATSGGGATNGTTLSVNGGAALTIANINSTTGLAAAITSTNITFSIVDRDFGDVTVSGSGTVFTVDNGVITTNKISAPFYTWIDSKPDLSDVNTWTETNTFTKPIIVPTIYATTLAISNAINVPSGGTGTNTHPQEAILVGNLTNAVKHLVAAANKLAGWNASGAVTNVSAGTGIAINDGVISATGTNAPQLGVNGTSIANPNLTNGPQISLSVAGSNITPVLNATSIDTNKVDATFHAALVKDDVGLGTNVIVNNVKIQPAKFTNNPAVTGGVLFSTNANGEIVAVATNLPASSGGPSTNYVNNLPYSPLKITNDTASVGGVVWTTNSNGDVKAQATNLPTVTNSPVTGLWQTLGSADIIVSDTGNTSASVTFTNYSGVVNGMTVQEPDGSDYRLQIALTFNENVGTNYLVLFDFDGSDNEDSAYGLQAWVQTSSRTGTGCDVSIADSDGFVYDYDGYKIRIRIVNPNATAGGEGGDVLTTADNVLSGVNQFTNGLGQVFSVPPRVLGGRINGWTASQMTPGTNATTQAQYKVLGDGIPSIEFDGATSEEISMVGLLSQDPDRGSFVTITFASDDTANTVCWQAQWQLLTLRGIDTNLLSTAATWTSNIPGTARVPTNITFSLNAPTGLVGSTNDFSKPYMLRITRLPGSDSSLSNAYVIGVDHRYGL